MQDHDVWRAARAVTLTQMGELSAARQALEGAPVAPGSHFLLLHIAQRVVEGRCSCRVDSN